MDRRDNCDRAEGGGLGRSAQPPGTGATDSLGFSAGKALASTSSILLSCCCLGGVHTDVSSARRSHSRPRDRHRVALARRRLGAAAGPACADLADTSGAAAAVGGALTNRRRLPARLPPGPPLGSDARRQVGPANPSNSHYR